MKRFQIIKDGAAMSEGVLFSSGRVAIDHPTRGTLIYESMERVVGLLWVHLMGAIQFVD